MFACIQINYCIPAIKPIKKKFLPNDDAVLQIQVDKWECVLV